MTASMRTTTSNPARIDSRARRANETSQIVLFGTAAWIGWVWVAATVAYAIVIASIARWGSVDQALWRPVASGWQRYIVFAAGVTVTTTFLRMLVRNGVTRRLLSIGAVATMVCLSVALSAWNVAGYAVEKAIFDDRGWPQQIADGRVFEWGDIPRLAVDFGLVIAAYYVAGWIVGCCYVRWGPVVGTVLLPLAILPAAAVELVVSPDLAGMDVDVVRDRLDATHAAVSVTVGLVVLLVALAVADRIMRETPLR